MIEDFAMGAVENLYVDDLDGYDTPVRPAGPVVLDHSALLALNAPPRSAPTRPVADWALVNVRDLVRAVFQRADTGADTTESYAAVELALGQVNPGDLVIASTMLYRARRRHRDASRAHAVQQQGARRHLRLRHVPRTGSRPRAAARRVRRERPAARAAPSSSDGPSEPPSRSAVAL